MGLRITSILPVGLRITSILLVGLRITSILLVGLRITGILPVGLRITSILLVGFFPGSARVPRAVSGVPPTLVLGIYKSLGGTPKPKPARETRALPQSQSPTTEWHGRLAHAAWRGACMCLAAREKPQRGFVLQPKVARVREGYLGY